MLRLPTFDISIHERIPGPFVSTGKVVEDHLCVVNESNFDQHGDEVVAQSSVGVEAMLVHVAEQVQSIGMVPLFSTFFDYTAKDGDRKVGFSPRRKGLLWAKGTADARNGSSSSQELSRSLHCVYRNPKAVCAASSLNVTPPR
ncbi:hypothetical protein GOP47_0021441 [Adiantum capillus-veneris]|uniref:Uncharacterized protein n=1 Tax=Adiantum capillus-veneris TaxID=13818 RepID=A0A9D4U995_ADICA|nr:hypothetical protein GOP47_0021441 [Adiantum capillus-veneris]